jgi:DNA polymerase I
MPDELFLIDGNSLAYRAFFALPESIATSTGMPTNAIFGFASMLVKILTDYGPKATVVVWDAGDTGRREVYSEYKAQRATRPDLLKEQWPHLEPLVDAFGYRNLRVQGFEADDVIASIVEQARTADPQIPVMVVTGDRDAYQLVDDGVVKIMTTSRGITDTRVYDRQGVIDRYGIPPELIPDFIGLKGDTSDNIPGVPGIGDKTAAELLQRFGTLEDVLGHVDDISGAKRKQNLTEHAEAARISKQLATAKRDIDVELDLQAFAAATPDRSKLRDTFRKFELREPLRRLEEALGSADAAAPPPEAERSLTARLRNVAVADLKRLPDREVAISVKAPENPPDQRPRRRLGRGAGRRLREAGGRRGGDRPPAGHRPRREVARRGAGGPGARHRGRGVPARAGSAGLPVPGAVRGAGAGRRGGRRGRRRRAAPRGPGRLAARGGPRARPDRPVRERRASARPRPAGDGAGRLQARHPPAA